MTGEGRLVAPGSCPPARSLGGQLPDPCWRSPPAPSSGPGTATNAYKAAAKRSAPVHFTEFSPDTQQWAQVELQPLGPAPLPGYPDAVHYQGKVLDGHLPVEMESWISGQSGEVKHVAKLAGLTVVLQRSELPAPAAPAARSGFFERTLAPLPPHPFLPWVQEAVLAWNGKGQQDLLEDGQQTRLGPNRYRVRVAAAPSTDEASEPPVKGAPAPEDAPFLAATPLLQFQDPAFNGVMARLRPAPAASRWNLAKQVTAFVFDWIRAKDLSVGFASALEVARNGQGDCTEHGVLAVALLRKLGVPARGVVGWAGLGETTGLHFWVEVKLGQRWVPVDPTFDQAPASAVRLKLGTTDLADLGSLGWDTAAAQVMDGAWVPEQPWAEAIRIDGESVSLPGSLTLRLPESRWEMREGHLRLQWLDVHTVLAVTRPAPKQVEAARLLSSPVTGTRGWWDPRGRILWLDLGTGRWLQVDRVQEAVAFKFLDSLQARP